MKILLVAINSKYIHSNLAVHSICKYTREKIGGIEDNIKLLEYTINHSNAEIIKGIYSEKADVIAFSCYIWNIFVVREIVKDIKKIQPEAVIYYGGPEVSYDAEGELSNSPELKGIMVGEGEATFKELAEFYLFGKSKLSDIAGLIYKDDGNKICVNALRQPLHMSDIPFPYDHIESFENKIIYYESSRGCPFSCSYCLSSIDRRVRFRDIELVKQELKILLDHNIDQVKFVDRTFNCNKKHAMEIWKFIKENDNGKTNFHFEISADLISDEEIALISNFRPGQVQFEIGVQSTNLDTIKAIHRTMDFEQLVNVVKELQLSNNVHLHLDIIAGLPEEDLESFIRTFNDVYSLKIEQLQLGFLKVLKGSPMERQSSNYELLVSSKTPYEILSTKWLSYDEILRLKAVEDMVETYYNTNQFVYSIQYLEHFFENYFMLYDELAKYYQKKKLNTISHSRLRRYEILLDFFKEICIDKNLDREYFNVFEEILLFDLYLRENLKSRPAFINKQRDYSRIYKEFYKNTNYQKYYSHLEYFDFDIINSSKTGKPIYKDLHIVFNYLERDALTGNASISYI